MCYHPSWVQDIFGRQVFEDDLYGRPVAMTGARVVMAQTLLEDFSNEDTKWKEVRDR